MTLTLKIDLDYKLGRACGWVKWCDQAAGLLRLLGLRPSRVDVRDTGRGHHVELDVALSSRDAPTYGKAYDQLVVVALQAILGSDHWREALNLGRALRGDVENILFVEKAVYHDRKLVRRSQAIPNEVYKRVLLKRLDVAFATKPPAPGGEATTDSGRRSS